MERIHALRANRATIFLSLIMLVVTSGCQLYEEVEQVPFDSKTWPVETIEVDHESIDLNVLDQRTITATPRGDGGNQLSGRTIEWTIEDTNVATIVSNDNLRITIQGENAGTTTLIGQSEGVDVRIAINVANPAVRVTVDPPAADLDIGQSLEIAATFFDAKDREMDVQGDWVSADQAVATVDRGTITGAGVGATTVTVSRDQASAEIDISVFRPIQQVELDQNPITTEVAQAVAVNAAVTDDTGTASDRPVSWEIEDETIATLRPCDGESSIQGPHCVRVRGEMGGSTHLIATSGSESHRVQVLVDNPVARVVVTPPSVTVNIGETSEQVTAELYDANNNLIEDDRCVNWRSNNTAYALVNTAGSCADSATITGGQNDGITNVSAVAEGVTGTVKVTVVNPPCDMELSEQTMTMIVGQSRWITATVRDCDGDVLRGEAVEWASADPSIVSVDQTGRVTAQQASDNPVTITAQTPGGAAVAQVDIWVEASVETVELDPAQATLAILDDPPATQVFTATLKDRNANVLSGRAINWTVSDDTVATITPTGETTARVTPLKSGVIQVRAASEQRVASAELTITAPVDTMAINRDPAVVGLNVTVDFQAVLRDTLGNSVNATYGSNVSWSVGDTSLASITNTTPDGKVFIQGLRNGQTTLTATLPAADTVAGAELSHTVTLKINAPVQTIDVSPQTLTVEVPDTAVVDVTPRDVNGDALADKVVACDSSDPAVATATVNAGGDCEVTAVSEGQITLTINSEGKSATVDVTVIAEPADLVFDPAEYLGFLGEDVQLSAYLLDPNGNSLTGPGREITYGSDDPAIISVDPTTGLATPVAEGSTTVTAEWTGQVDGQQTTLTATADFRVVEWIDVDPGYRHACGIVTGGKAYCWGNNENGQLGDGGAPEDRRLPTPVDTDKTFIQIAAGVFHTCGVTTPRGVAGTHEIWCWGYGQNGALGNGQFQDSPTPVKVAGNDDWAQVVVGINHSCGLTASGTAFCWGINEYAPDPNQPTQRVTAGVLGHGGIHSSAAPAQVSTGELFTEISAGYLHSCGVTRLEYDPNDDTVIIGGGEALCWGLNDEGQLGDGTNTKALAPVSVSTTEQFKSVATGYEHACAVTLAGDAYCWGTNEYGDLGINATQAATPNSNTPVQVVGNHTYEAIFAEVGNNACAITTSGTAYCWGFNGQGNLGNGGLGDILQPTKVNDSQVSTWTKFSPSLENSCGISDENGFAWCTGNNEEGQLGQPSADLTDNAVIPEAVTNP